VLSVQEGRGLCRSPEDCEIIHRREETGGRRSGDRELELREVFQEKTKIFVKSRRAV
jgi:hypothetical protein